MKTINPKKRGIRFEKSALEEVQERMMWAFTGFAMLLLAVLVCWGCAALRWYAGPGHGWQAFALWAAGAVLVWPLGAVCRRFARLGDEEARLQWQADASRQSQGWWGEG